MLIMIIEIKNPPIVLAMDSIMEVQAKRTRLFVEANGVIIQMVIPKVVIRSILISIKKPLAIAVDRINSAVLILMIRGSSSKRMVLVV